MTVQMQSPAQHHPFLDKMTGQFDTVPNMIYGTLAIITISFADQIPPSFSIFADTVLGRIIGIVLILVTGHFMGFPYGLLTALAFLLILHASPRISAQGTTVDGFQDLTSYDTVGTRWFVERVLGERPEKITNDKARTSAVQDLSEKAMTNSRSNSK